MSKPEKLANGLQPLSDAEIDEGVDNLVRSLDALDQKGEAGLQAELDRIYPPTDLKAVGLTKVPLGPVFPESHSLRSEKSYLQTVASKSPAA